MEKQTKIKKKNFPPDQSRVMKLCVPYLSCLVKAMDMNVQVEVQCFSYALHLICVHLQPLNIHFFKLMMTNSPRIIS